MRAKLALEDLSQALAEELAPFGVCVMIVEPGAIRAAFNSAKLAAPTHRIAAYAGTLAGDMTEIMHHFHGRQLGDPDMAAEAILTALDADAPPLRLALGADALGWTRGKLARVTSDFDSWESVSVATARATEM